MNQLAGIIGAVGFLLGFFLAILFIMIALKKKNTFFHLVPVGYCFLFEAVAALVQGRGYNPTFAVAFATLVMVLGWLTVRFKIWMPRRR
jgi:hypothetical protein